MRAEGWRRRALDLNGWRVQLTSYLLAGRYLAEVEVESSGVTIARATELARSDAENRALEKATVRLQATSRVDLDLTVGG